ncbi:MAG TPA: zinc ABC transporter substrate-binding protein [Chloroflexota bacterium]
MNRPTQFRHLILRALSLSAFVLAGSVLPATAQSAPPPPAHLVKVLGVENEYQDIANQVGGNRVQTYTILSDPSVDPHLYETNVDDAKIVASADIIIENGVGYDDFADHLMAASPRPDRILLKVETLTGHQPGDNPHLWYDTFNTMPALIPALVQALSKKDPAGAQFYAAQGQTFLNSLSQIQAVCNTIKQKYSAAPVLATEPLWNYQAKPCGVNVLDAEGPFQKATQDGNDPPAFAVAKFRDQLNSGAAKLLMFNNQAVTPMSQQMQGLAQANNIAVVAMSETEPPNTPYQQWMTSQLQAVLQALGG